MALEPGSTFAGYRIERRLGAGGMGAVYLGKHPRLPRKDAIKILDATLGSDEGFRARFEREAELTARLDHANIVTIHDRGIEGGRLWISMQYVDGVDAAQLIKKGPMALPPQRTIHIISEAAKGLDYAHRNGLLHRDVKPANILISTDDEGDKVLVSDFGIARTLDDTTALTSTGSFLATIAYAAPELIEGNSVDHRIDIYALGCTLFEMLTGSVPFVRPNPVAVMHAHVTASPPRPSLANPALPKALDDVIARAMAKNPAERFSTCREMAAAASMALSGVPTGGMPTVVNPAPSLPMTPAPFTGPLAPVSATPTRFASPPRTPPPPSSSGPHANRFASPSGPSTTRPTGNTTSRRPLIIGAGAAAAIVAIIGIVWAVSANKGSSPGGGGATTTPQTALGPCAQRAPSGADVTPTKPVTFTGGNAVALVTAKDGTKQCISYNFDSTGDNNVDPSGPSFNTTFKGPDSGKLLVDMTADKLQTGTIDGFVAIGVDGKYYPDGWHKGCVVAITQIDNTTLAGTFDCTDIPEQAAADDTVSLKGWFSVHS